MTKEEFIEKLETDEILRKAFEKDPVKVIQDNSVELSLEDLEKISGGFSFNIKISDFKEEDLEQLGGENMNIEHLMRNVKKKQGRGKIKKFKPRDRNKF